MIEKQLIPFQVYLLRQLNLLYPDAASIRRYKSAWLTNNLTRTENDTDLLISQLLQEKYIQEPERQAPVLYDYFQELDSRNAHHEYAITQKGRDYLAALDAPKKNVVRMPTAQPDINKTAVEATSYISYFKGKWQGKKGMKNEEYKRLLEYTIYLLDNNKVPENIAKIPPTFFPTHFIQHTYYRLQSFT